MLGLGKWLAKIDNMFFKGDAVFTISGSDGNYDFKLELPNGEFDIPDIDIYDITEDGDTLNAKATVSLLPGKEIDVSLTFCGDSCNGFLKIPFIGKIKLKDAQKIG